MIKKYKTQVKVLDPEQLTQTKGGHHEDCTNTGNNW